MHGICIFLYFDDIMIIVIDEPALEEVITALTRTYFMKYESDAAIFLCAVI